MLAQKQVAQIYVNLKKRIVPIYDILYQPGSQRICDVFFTNIFLGDKVGWIAACLSELDKKHIEEREILLMVLQDRTLEDLKDVAQRMTLEEKQRRLAKIHSKSQRLELRDAGRRWSDCDGKQHT